MPKGFHFAEYPLLKGTEPATPPKGAPALIRAVLVQKMDPSPALALRRWPQQVLYGGPAPMGSGPAAKAILQPWAWARNVDVAIEEVPITPHGWAGHFWPHHDFRWWLEGEMRAEPRYQMRNMGMAQFAWHPAPSSTSHGEWVAGEELEVETGLFKFPGLSARSPQFFPRLVEVARELRADPNHLLAVMQVESGIRPDARNPRGGATGLIQFMPSTARALGTTVEALAAMSDARQLDYVQFYYEPYKGRLRSAGDVYMATFLPAHLGMPDSFVLARKGDKVYDWNAALDSDKDGALTVADVKRKAEKSLADASKAGYFTPPKQKSYLGPMLGVAALGVGIFLKTARVI